MKTQWTSEEIKNALEDLDKMMRPYVVMVHPSRVKEFEAAVGDIVVIKPAPVSIDKAYAFSREEWEKIEKGDMI